MVDQPTQIKESLFEILIRRLGIPVVSIAIPVLVCLVCYFLRIVTDIRIIFIVGVLFSAFWMVGVIFIAYLFGFAIIHYIKPCAWSESDAPADHDSLAINRWIPGLKNQVARQPLANYPTPITSMNLNICGNLLKIHVKREDVASNVYSGVKVRTLEFLIGCAKAKQKSLGREEPPIIWSIGSPGSNLAVALSAFAEKADVSVGNIIYTPQPPFSWTIRNLEATSSIPIHLRVTFDVFSCLRTFLPLFEVWMDENAYLMAQGGASHVGCLVQHPANG